MAVIEQLPESSPSASGSSATNPAGPSATLAGWANQPPSSTPSRSLEETLKSFDSVPFFMQDLSSATLDAETQTKLDALQSLAFDGTPDEVAANFKAQGNEHFLAKRYRDALGFYSQGIEADPEEAALKETLRVNRAACHLELGNFGMCLRDTAQAVALNPRNVKAYYRAARALLALDRTEDCVKTCDLALEFDAENLPVQTVRRKALEREASVRRTEAERAERTRRSAEGERALTQAFLSRGLWIETSPRPPDNPVPAHFDPDSLPAESAASLPLLGQTRWTPPDPIRTPLVLPVFFVYPAHGQSDLIQSYHEDTPLHLHLDAMFPSPPSLPWDTKGVYTSANLVVYATTQKMRLLKLGRKLTLRQVMDQAARDAPDASRLQERDGMVLRDGILSLVVLPKGEEESKWVEEFKRQREQRKGRES